MCLLAFLILEAEEIPGLVELILSRTMVKQSTLGCWHRPLPRASLEYIKIYSDPWSRSARAEAKMGIHLGSFFCYVLKFSNLLVCCV